MVPSSRTVCYGALDPQVGGTFHFENLIMPPLTKTCPKMVLSHKGGSLCVKDVFAKKIFGAGRDAAAGPGSELQIRILMPDGRFRELSGNPARVAPYRSGATDSRRTSA